MEEVLMDHSLNLMFVATLHGDVTTFEAAQQVLVEPAPGPDITANRFGGSHP